MSIYSPTLESLVATVTLQITSKDVHPFVRQLRARQNVAFIFKLRI